MLQLLEKFVQQLLLIIHHKNCMIDIIKKLKKVPIKKNIMVRAVLTASVEANAAIVDTSVPIVPTIKLLPCSQIHFFNDEKLLRPAIGIRKSNAISDKIDKPNAIHKAKITFGIKLRLNKTEIPIPIIMLRIIAVTLLQEFCLHILTILSIKLGRLNYLLSLYAQDKFLLI